MARSKGEIVGEVSACVGALITHLEKSGQLAAQLGELLEAPPLAEVSVELYNLATDVRQVLGEKVSQ